VFESRLLVQVSEFAQTIQVGARTLRRMAACPSCGDDNPAAQRFCGSCGTALTTAKADPAPEERKVVTALFCDLVGFTAASESADPEDIDRMLNAYFALAKSQIETHGGVVEKFIGDAVLGVFGVPATHEDDPERAVRAGLRICEEAERLSSVAGAPLRLRVGINTGEALVRLGVVPDSGEHFLVGDAINTASRIQSIAPEMGVGVGLATYDATKGTIEYAELEPATLKGKSEPVRVFQAIALRARLGVNLTRAYDSPYVGREIDLALLNGLFDKTLAASTVQLATVVGEPGIGKSRIVAELLGHAQARSPALTWRQGRCLPYGDGVTFWALGEIVKAQAGILESDDPAVASAKIDDAVPSGPDRDWLRQRLLPLIGVDATSGAGREELFTAWRTFLESLAEAHPTVLVFEDIHWADGAMLAFLEHLADRAEGVPLLIVATARPELFERHPAFAAGVPRVNRINLGPLSNEETRRLVAGRLGAAVPPELHAPILERAEGNPLYAEEFVRLLRDRDLLIETDEGVTLRPGAEVPLPESIGALIAARLDTLPSERKTMLADAAVVGKVFWTGAVAEMGERDSADVIDAMRELGRKELIRSARHSSMAGEAEYAFWHVLVRDVAYAQLPRASRAARHVAAAQWLEAKAGDRAEDIAEVLAHHYATALELTRAAGQTDRAHELERPALRFLTLAGDRALYLDAASAMANFEKALMLTPPGHEARPDVLARFGQAAYELGQYNEALTALDEATGGFRDRGDLLAAARSMFTTFGVLQSLGDPRQWVIMPEAATMLEPLPPSRELLDVLARVAANESIQGHDEVALQTADHALTIAAEHTMPRPALALRVRGVARADLGDPAGFDDMREAIGLAIAAGGRGVPGAYNDLAVATALADGPAASIPILRLAIAFAEARGLKSAIDFLTLNLLNVLFEVGEHDEVLRGAAELAPRLERIRHTDSLLGIRVLEATIFALRGLGERVPGELEWIEQTARRSEVMPSIVSCLGASAVAHAAFGQRAAAHALLTEIEVNPNSSEFTPLSGWLPAMVRTAIEIGDMGLAERIGTDLTARYPYGRFAIAAAAAAMSEARGELSIASTAYADVADQWESFGVVTERAFALLGHGRCLILMGQPNEAAPVLQQAGDIFERLHAAPALAQVDALLERQPKALRPTINSDGS
jgi:class 3 adenylate cyclase/tetratricopeptide (TPR) repeat protein